MTVVLQKVPPVKFPTDGIPSLELFDDWIDEGLNYRNIKLDKRYGERLNYERKIIVEKGFVDYFLITADLVTFAKNAGIPVGPGRGSAAASLICYLLRITEIDPVPTPMLFERFIDPTRDDMPDIDIDFADDRVDEVMNYAAEKYGSDCVARIANFQRYKGKNSIDDVARVYHIPLWQAEKLKSSLIERPDGHSRVSHTIEDTIDTFSNAREVVKESPELGLYAPRLEQSGYRTLGIHAAGLVISPVPINNVSAILTKGDNQAIAYDKRDAKYLGILKFDILSLSTLGMIAKCLEFIGMTLEELYALEPGADRATMEMFSSGDVLGIFQFEGGTTRRICKAVKPETIEHLSDINALSRPGPLGAQTDIKYARDKNAGTIAPVKHEIVAKHTNYTYGHIVYQEQILRTLAELGNFPPVQINAIRKIIQDKTGTDAFNKLYQEFESGAKTHGCSSGVAADIWNDMVNAAGYAFNIPHSRSYSTLAYWQGYLKCHYSEAFWASQLYKNGDGKQEKPRRTKLLQAAVNDGIAILPPDPVSSGFSWTLADGAIVAGLEQIEGIAGTKAQNIIDYRVNAKPGKEIEDWDDLKHVKGIGPVTIEKIIKFCDSKDPFGIGSTKKALESIRSGITNGQLGAIWEPTHNSIDLPKDGSRVVFLGAPKKRKYFDAIVQAKKKSKVELSTEDVLKVLPDPDKLKYAMVECEDEFGETIVLFISRWTYPKYAHAIENLKIGRDVIVAKGKGSDFFGGSVKVDQMVVLNPYA